MTIQLTARVPAPRSGRDDRVVSECHLRLLAARQRGGDLRVVALGPAAAWALA